MVHVSGDLRIVTGDPSTVRHVIVRSPRARPHGDGMITGEPARFPVDNGRVEFEAAPGPVIVVLERMQDSGERFEGVVPDEETATLAECLDQVYVYDPPVVGRAQMFAREAGEHADRAEAGADRVGSAEQVGAWVGEAEVLHDDTVAAAEHAETQAGVAAGHAEQAGEDRAQTGADRRQTGEDRAQTGEDREAAEEATDTSVEASALAVLAATQFDQLIGDGMPEGVVSAPVGTIYTDRQATAGAVKWIKVSGTGPTGWQVLWGNTGLRKLATFHTDGTLTNHGGASDPSGFTSYSDTVEGGLWVRRVNQKVTYYLRGRTTGGQIIRLPLGMRPDGNPYTVTTIPYSSTASQNVAVGASAIYVSIPTGLPVPSMGGAYSTAISFDTYIPWPTTRPGIPDD